MRVRSESSTAKSWASQSGSWMVLLPGLKLRNLQFARMLGKKQIPSDRIGTFGCVGSA
jgi:hypothetical protein